MPLRQYRACVVDSLGLGITCVLYHSTMCTRHPDICVQYCHNLSQEVPRSLKYMGCPRIVLGISSSMHLLWYTWNTGDVPGLSQVREAWNPWILSIPGYWGYPGIVPGMGALESLSTKYPGILGISRDCPRYGSPGIPGLFQVWEPCNP